MSPDERLENYVQENDIIDIDVDEALLVSDFDEDKEYEEEFDQMNPPVELDDAAFLGGQASHDSNEDDDNDVGSHHGAVTTYAQDNNVMVVGVRQHCKISQLCSKTYFLQVSRRM
jgi:hypothetical protein